MRNLLFLLLTILTPFVAYSQTTLKGTISEANSGELVIGANVYLIGTTLGAATNVDGAFTIKNVPAGEYVIRVSSIGYQTINKTVVVEGNSMTLDFELILTSESLEALEVFASRSDQSTPVAYSDISKEALQVQLGSRDLPEVLNITPSVYSTNQGGGAGDARINVRGFSQRNVAVMINGVPVNDMENGWVYWSNWDGVGDVARSIQVQRGISNVNLAVPSVGGTLNIITDPTSNETGGAVKFENGSGSLRKTTMILNSGMINDKYAFSFVGVRKTGAGLMEGTWTDAWAYHAAASYQINDVNRIELFALGAPQRHGQNLYMQNIATYDRDFALSLDGYDPAAADQYTEKGRFFNQNVANVSSSYAGKQYIGDGWTGPSIANRYDATIINERENFFHKPQVNLNWYSQINEKVTLTNVLYYSGGKGGGTGTYGSSPVRDFTNGAYKILWDETIARNVANGDTSRTILRNSRNNQWTVGDILKVTANVNENLEIQAGIDWRTAEIEHYREVRDLLGGDLFIENGQAVGLGDKIAYNYNNNVNWIGGFVQGEYSKDALTTYATAGISNIKYKHDNFMLGFKRESDNIIGWQLKGGALYDINETLGVYANLGAISKVPIFDNVINDGNGAVNEDPENEKFFFYEAGLRFNDTKGKLAGNLNFYITDRRDRSFTQGVTQQNGTDAIINITGLDQRHTGVELELGYRPTDYVRFDIAAAHNLWEYQNDVSAIYLADVATSDQDTVNLFLKGLKVGNAPQTQFSYIMTLEPTNRLDVTVVGTSFLRHFSEFDPLTRNDASDRAQTWEMPNYTVFNVHLNYDIPSILAGSQLFINVFNIFDETYIQDAVDNSRYNGFDGDHDADDAEVFLGLPRRYNFGIRVNF